MPLPSLTIDIPADFHLDLLHILKPRTFAGKPEPMYTAPVPTGSLPAAWRIYPRGNDDFVVARTRARTGSMLIVHRGEDGRFDEITPRWGDAPVKWQILMRHCSDHRCPPETAFVGRKLQANVSLVEAPFPHPLYGQQRPFLSLYAINVLGDLDLETTKAACKAYRAAQDAALSERGLG